MLRQPGKCALERCPGTKPGSPAPPFYRASPCARVNNRGNSIGAGSPEARFSGLPSGRWGKPQAPRFLVGPSKRYGLHGLQDNLRINCLLCSARDVLGLTEQVRHSKSSLTVCDAPGKTRRGSRAAANRPTPANADRPGDNVSSTTWPQIRPWVGLPLLAAATAWMLQDAAARRASQAARAPQVRAVARLVGAADLALSNTSRWLRHPSLTEPGAPFADGPAILDNDPAGAALAPPRAVLAGVTEVSPDPTWRPGKP